jgi:hypothetical protein
MKTLFVAPLLDFSGFSHAARAMLQMLNHAGVDLVARPLKYDVADSGSEYQPEEWITGLLEKPLTEIDLVIQSTTPNVEAVPVPAKFTFEWDKATRKVCNAIYTFVETDRIPQTWVEKLNQFDFIIVSSKYNATTMVRSGVRKPIVCAPVPFDPEQLNQPATSSKPLVENPGNRTVFYNICQLTAKKGIDSLIRAYYGAFFDKPDEVLLVLKTYIGMAGRQNERAIIKQFIDKVRQGCRMPINKYPPIQVITKTLTDADIHQLHREGHAYVNASRAEGFCLPAFDAMAHGNLLISNSFGGMADFVLPEAALVYGGCLTHCYEMPCGDPLQYTGIARWFEPSTAEMADMMRGYHDLRFNQAILTEQDRAKWESIEVRKKNAKLVTARHDYRLVSERVTHQLKAAFNSWNEHGSVTFDTTAAVAIES